MIGKLGKLVVLMLFLTVLMGGAAAQVTVQDVTVTPDEAWSDETVDMTVRCQADGNDTVLTDAYISITSPINDHIALSDKLPVNATNASMTVSYSPPQLGVYEATATCEAEQDGETYDASASLGFTQKQLVVDGMTFTGTPLYTDSPLRLTFNVYEEYGSGKNDITDAGVVDAHLDLPSWTEHDLYHDGNTWVLTGDALLDQGTYRAQLAVNVDGHTTSTSQTVDVYRPFRANLETDDTGASPAEDISILAAPKYRENALTLDDVTIETVTVNGESIVYETTADTVTVRMPDTLDADTVTITVDMRYVDDNGDVYTTERLELPTLYRVHGRFTDVDGSPITGRIMLEDGDTEVSTVFNDGKYQLQVPKGAYQAVIRDVAGLPEISIDGIDVSTSRENILQIDTPQTLDVAGIDVFGAVGIDTVADFSTAHVKISYDPRDAKSEDDLSLFHCPVYNWDARYCYGEWNQVAADINTQRNYLATDTEKLGAFIVGRHTPLTVDATIDNTYPMDDTVQLRGAVKDAHGNAVPNATVTATLGEHTATATTGDRGGFSLDIDTPATEGSYTLQVTARKPYYTQAREEHNSNITADRSINLNTPDNPHMTAGQSREYTVTVRNTGQVPINDLSVNATVAGCNTCITGMSPADITELSEFEKQAVTFTINTSSGHADSMLTTTVTVQNDHINEDAVFLVDVAAPGQDGMDTEDTDTDQPSAEDAVTGYLSAVSLPALPAFPTLSSMDGMTLVNLVSVLIAVTILGYFKYTDRRTPQQDCVPDEYRLKQLRNEAMDAVTIVDTTQTRDTADDTPGTPRIVESHNTDARDTYACPDCDRAFDSERGLSVHTTKKHTD